MGIPVFFKTLITNYDDLLLNSEFSERVNHNLYLDLNCAIHPCCSGETDEAIMIQKIITKINDLVELVKPISEIFIAIDGVAPKAKMIQQRSRRHKSITLHKPWDTNMISPGTPFMKKLSLELQKTYTDNRFVLSDSDVPGEGEHKILQRIKLSKLSKQSKQSNHVIYGLDADLIMLSLVSNCNTIFLLRERTEYNIENLKGEYIYMDIDVLKKNICDKIPNVPPNIAIDDYIFICFFLGNDFIKNSPSINLRYDGLDSLLSLYNSVQKDYHYKFQIINRSVKDLINYEYLKRLIEKLELDESKRMFRIFTIRKKQNYRCKQNLSRIVDPVEAKEFEDYNKPILHMKDEYHIFKDKKWQPRYNEYLSIPNDLLCSEYLKSILWTTHYYFDECIDWSFAYDFCFSPTLYDLKNYILQNETIVFEKKIEVPSVKEQLLFIMPFKTLENLGFSKKDSIPFVPNEKHLLKRYEWEVH